MSVFRAGKVRSSGVCGGMVSPARSLTELSIPRARSMTKNTTAQNVDPDRVEMASGYRMKTRPAPVRNVKDLINSWDCWSELQLIGEHFEAQQAPAQPHDVWAVVCRWSKPRSKDD